MSAQDLDFVRLQSHQGEEERYLPTRQSLLVKLRSLENEPAWREFFEKYWKFIYNAVIGCGLSHADAEDIVQETVLTVTRTIQEFRYDSGRGSFKGWLMKTTRWRILDHLRKEKRFHGSNPRPVEEPGTMGQPVADGIDDQLTAFWEQEWQQNLADAAIEAIKLEVDPKHFQIFDLYALKGRPADRVAAMFGVTTAQVHLTKHRITNRIRAEVERLQESGI